MSWDVSVYAKVAGLEEDLKGFIRDARRLEGAIASHIAKENLENGYILWQWESWSFDPLGFLSRLSRHHPELKFEIQIISNELHCSSEVILKGGIELYSFTKVFSPEELAYPCGFDSSDVIENTLYRKYFYQQKLSQEFTLL